MNKRLCLSTAALTLLSPLAALADDPTGPTVWDGFSGFLSPDWSQDFSATVGVKIWINDWSRDSFLTSRFNVGDIVAIAQDTAPDNQESDIEPVPIPQISARYKWLFVTSSYYAKTGFDFDDSQSTLLADVDTDGDGVRDTTGLVVNTFRTSGERYEWDASAGVYIHPWIALLGGYKKVSQALDFTITSNVTRDGPTSLDEARFVSTAFSNIDIEGPTIGIAGSVPIGRGFGMYASYAHGFMDAEIRNGFPDDGAQDLEFDATYDVAELGFSYTHGTQDLAPHMPLSAATVYAGYRYQNISTEFDEPNQDRADVTKGFAVGVNFTF